MSEPSPGPSTDRHNDPVVDPTKNVLDLVDAAVRRVDDLLDERNVRFDAAVSHIKEIGDIRAFYDERLRVAETARIDAIRAVDVSAVQRATEVASAQAEALRTQVAAAAAAQQSSTAALLDPIQKDIADLRRAQYEAQGVKAQTGETRLNIGAILGGISVFLVLVFGLISVAIALTVR